jgi:hypothetical protein
MVGTKTVNGERTLTVCELAKSRLRQVKAELRQPCFKKSDRAIFAVENVTAIG